MKNVEIKAKCENPSGIEKTLFDLGAYFKGTDFQTDIYFNVNHGRLKLRQGNIENSLIYYDRPDKKGPKRSEFELFKTSNLQEIKPLLEKALGIMVKVEKKRKIFYIDFVKFHIDEIKGLGSFVEIEAGDLDDTKTMEELQKACDYYMRKLGIKKENLINISYSDMLMKQKNSLS